MSEMIRINVGGRIYELVSCLKEGESCVSGDAMVERARKLDANLGKEDGRFILEHQEELPTELRGKLFVFTDWRCPLGPWGVAYLRWGGARWSQGWRRLHEGWFGAVAMRRCA